MTQSGVGKVEAFREEGGKQSAKEEEGKGEVCVQPGLTI